MKKTLHFIVWIMIPFSALAQSTAWKAKVDPVVLKKAETNATFEFVAVLKQQADVSAADNLDTKEEKAMFVYNSLKAAADHSQAEITTLLTKANATFHPFWVVNCVVVTADVKTLEDVANLASVETIIENAKYVAAKTIKTEAKPSDMNAAEWGITKTKADQAWALGVKGAGAVIAGEDTGYEWTHPALKKNYRGWNGSTADHNYNWHDAVHSGGGTKCGANSKQPCDDQEHGTHTMGTMCGEDGANQIGMAPAAKWMGCRNMNVGVGTLESYIECFQFFLAPTDLTDKNPDPLKSPHVINNSWGCPTDEGCNSSNFSTMETVVNNLRAAGVVVVASAGNDGSKGCSSINTPAAILAGSFTVGSTTTSDAISSFSSLGPVTNYGTRVSPDISAPGSNVRSSVPGGGYSSMSGTSMAGPHVAGLVALVVSANPGLAGQVAKIEDIIQKTAVKLSSANCSSTAGVYPNNTFGHGRIDALAAVKEAIKLLSIDNNSAKTLTSVVAYPNPFSESVNFEFKNCKPGTILEVFAITGEKVISKTWEATPSTYELDLSTYASGAYFYKLTNGAEHVNGKLFKVAQ